MFGRFGTHVGSSLCRFRDPFADRLGIAFVPIGAYFWAHAHREELVQKEGQKGIQKRSQHFQFFEAQMEPRRLPKTTPKRWQKWVQKMYSKWRFSGCLFRAIFDTIWGSVLVSFVNPSKSRVSEKMHEVRARVVSFLNTEIRKEPFWHPFPCENGTHKRLPKLVPRLSQHGTCWLGPKRQHNKKQTKKQKKKNIKPTLKTQQNKKRV